LQNFNGRKYYLQNFNGRKNYQRNLIPPCRAGCPHPAVHWVIARTYGGLWASRPTAVKYYL
jgi:hypothetical protein